MKEIHPHLFVGSEQDYESVVSKQAGWRVVHACKEPYHRRALGYSGRAAPKTHPEYLIARRGDRLILNLVDAPDPAYIPKDIIDAALEFVDVSLNDGKQVLVHCNEGCSRAPSIAFLYLMSRTDQFVGQNTETAFSQFRLLYPSFNPALGMRGFIHAHFGTYCRSHESSQPTDTQTNTDTVES
jgi:hypothetical protein